MILFDDSRYHKTKNNGIYLKYNQIEELTEMILADFKPEVLTEPQAVDYDEFLECYLEVNLDYQHIYTTSNQGEILGCAIFEEQSLPVFDKENMCKKYIKYDPNTVILDLSLVGGERKVQENITGLHEGGHIWLHSYYFRECEGQTKIKTLRDGRFCCRKSGMEQVEYTSPSTDEMWREWQATTFAVTMALPRKSLDISVVEIFHKYGINEKQLVMDADNQTWYLANNVIPEELKKIYKMSKESIRYRLEKTGYYTTKKKYEEEHAQLCLFDFIN